MSAHDSSSSTHLVSIGVDDNESARLNGACLKVPAPLEDDLGTALVREMYDTWQVDDERAVWHSRRFSWSGHRCRQKVWSEPGFITEGRVIGSPLV